MKEAAAEAKIIEEDKAEAAKREENGKNSGKRTRNAGKRNLKSVAETSENMELEEGDHHIPQPLSRQIQDCIKAADELFKMKRYPEAKEKI